MLILCDKHPPGLSYLLSMSIYYSRRSIIRNWRIQRKFRIIAIFELLNFELTKEKVIKLVKFRIIECFTNFIDVTRKNLMSNIFYIRCTFVYKQYTTTVYTNRLILYIVLLPNLKIQILFVGKNLFRIIECELT